MSDGGIAAVNWVLLTKVVGRFAPFQFTTEEEMKPLPFTVSVNAAAPCTTLAGDTELIVGAGFWGGGTVSDPEPQPHKHAPTPNRRMKLSSRTPRLLVWLSKQGSEG